MPRLRAALFLDRDGVLNEPVWDERSGAAESPLRPGDVVLAEGATRAVQRANAAGLPVVIVSNQPAAAKGVVNVAALDAVHVRVTDLIARAGGRIDASYVCHHHPDGVIAHLTLRCDCRKPGPGLFFQAAQDLGLNLPRSWLVGDTDADVGAARHAGLAGVIVVRHALSAHRRTAIADSADATSTTTPEAIDLAIDRIRANGPLSVS
jgi:D-glycero-D-manno-heptose 1,7-bisphosphate phosphatase